MYTAIFSNYYTGDTVILDAPDPGFDVEDYDDSASLTVLGDNDTLAFLCECCAIAEVNADTSGCDAYCGSDHVEQLCEYGLEPGEHITVPGGTVSRVERCLGCGEDTYEPFPAIISQLA